MAKETKATKATKATKGSDAAKKAAATKAAKKDTGKVTKGKVSKLASLLKVAAIRYTSDGEDGVRYVYFRLTDVKGVAVTDLEKVTVSLSRVPGGCIFAIDKLHSHDGHAPPFHAGGNEEFPADQPYYRYGGEKAADAYLERVFADLLAKVGEVLPGTGIEFEKTEWTNKMPAHPGDEESKG
jgi:hypothetical protein